MSSSNILRVSLSLPNVNVLTFGDSSLFGYDSVDHSLIVYSLTELNHFSSSLNNPLRLLPSSPPSSSPIRRLILNPDQTILALISDSTAYLLYLPQSINSPSKDRIRCPVSVLPSLNSDSSSTNSSLIDFLWLSPRHFVVVHSLPSPSECHLYIVRPSQNGAIQYLRSFSLESSSTIKNRSSGTPTKKISLDQTMSIVKLDLAKRKYEQFTSILLFALKENGDIFVMDIDQNQLLNSEHVICPEFIGPLVISPSRTDNYGSDYRHSNLLCLSFSQNTLVIFTSSPSQLNQCLLLNKSQGDYQLFTIDAVNLPRIDSNNPIFKSMTKNALNPNMYYVYDSLFNVYSIEISWIEKIEQKEKTFPPTRIQHRFKSNDPIEQLALIQSNHQGQWLTILTKKPNSQQKELIFFRPNSSSLPASLPRKSQSLIVARKPTPSNVPMELEQRIRSILARDQSFPSVTSSSSSTTNLSDQDFQQNLVTFLTHLSEQYLDKQKKAQTELENKERFLNDFEQLQWIAKQELDRRVQGIHDKFQTLNEHYQQECSRRIQLSSEIDHDLSMIEQHTSVVSNAEIVLHKQLQRYEIQVNILKKKISLLTQFISEQPPRNRIDRNIDPIQDFLQYYRTTINEMKEQLHTMDQSNQTR